LIAVTVLTERINKKNAWAASVGGYIFSHKSSAYGPGRWDDFIPEFFLRFGAC